MNEIEIRNLRLAFFAIYSDVVNRWGHPYDEVEAEQMWQGFLRDLASSFDHWSRALVS